ncbi:MAG: hypothetical protein DLM72_15135, partial [Candidatus Nitrosopolaris wilkensis]
MAMIIKLLLCLVIAISMVTAFPMVASIRAQGTPPQQQCPNGSQPDSNGSCPPPQQQQQPQQPV